MEVSDRYQLHRSIVYLKAAMVCTQNRPTALYLRHVTSPITPPDASPGEERVAAPPHIRTFQLDLRPIIHLLLHYSSYIYDGSSRALLSADLHSLCLDKQEAGDWRPSDGGQQRDIE
jgi:hypothetical protein